ncbi:MAG: hypoxanthine phosphoribosyltransferase [Phycisphaerae bacterium]|nr:hypoxanthine phosphoribosyltransferase [Phycisphaerae bacterium]
MEAEIDRILIRDHDIARRVAAMADEIAAAYPSDAGELTLVPILSGSIIFVADLMRRLPRRMRLAMVSISTYPGRSTRPTEARTTLELRTDLEGRDVLIVDDILDTGGTLARVRAMVRERGARSVRAAVLLRKPGKAPPGVDAEFVGFDIADEFVVGYGLDYDDLYRNYPHIGVLRPEVMR